MMIPEEAHDCKRLVVTVPPLAMMRAIMQGTFLAWIGDGALGWLIMKFHK
jgi:hypothetical protein